MRVLEACPRRFALQYIGNTPRGESKQNLRTLGRRRPSGDYMRRAVSEAIHRRLLALKRNERTSPGDEAAWVRDHVRAAFMSGGEASHLELEMSAVDNLVSRAQHRARHSREIDLLKRIDAGESMEWLPLERRQPRVTHRRLLWTAPDLIVHIDGTWNLVRFAMEAGRSGPREHERLELGLMLDWAMAEPSLPSDPAAFRIRRIAWRWDRWVDWQRPGTADWMRESRDLLDADIHILRRAHLKLDGFANLDALPTARKRRECVSCGYRAICPGSLVKPIKAG